MAGQMEISSARNVTPAFGGTPDDPDQTVTPAPHPLQSDSVQDVEKIRVSMLFSGVLLSLVGAIFTAMGWLNYQESLNFEWTQLLGPVLLSVGGTFMLTSICKLGLMSCESCRHWDEEAVVIPAVEQTSPGQSFVFNGINQPITLQSSTAVLCIPPPYNFVSQELNPAGGPSSHPPWYDAVCCVDNAAFTAGNRDAGCRRSR
ncbi:hypothetical protein LDENG_00295670 [Lucifuga dentata]|nr:hypothetical protein LDENG_00295670 [Lucifuga dentata]